MHLFFTAQTTVRSAGYIAMIRYVMFVTGFVLVMFSRPSELQTFHGRIVL